MLYKTLIIACVNSEPLYAPGKLEASFIAEDHDDISVLYALTAYIFTSIIQIKSKSESQGHIFWFCFSIENIDVMMHLLNQCFFTGNILIHPLVE